MGLFWTFMSVLRQHYLKDKVSIIKKHNTSITGPVLFGTSLNDCFINFLLGFR
jgi:hypothetical protein